MIDGDIRDWPRRVLFGVGKRRELARVLSDLGSRRAVIVCGKTVASGPLLGEVTASLGVQCAGVFGGVRAHTPFEDVQRAAGIVRDLRADAIVTVGGGSAIDCGKGIVLLSATSGDFAPYSIDYAAKGMQRQALPKPTLRHVALPTTAGSASDVMPTAGIRHPQQPRKMLFWDAHLVPDATILDAELAVHADARLTAATGMTALARAIEGLYSKHRHPISTGLALHAARLLRVALPRSVAQPDDLEARSDCLMASLMSGTASINAMVSIVHAIGHVVGPRWHLQHGISHAMLLGPALRRMLPSIGPDQRFVLEALGCDPAGSADQAAAALAAMLATLPLPQRLRDVGIAAGDLHAIAAETMSDYMMANVPTPLTAADVGALLEEAW